METPSFRAGRKPEIRRACRFSQGGNCVKKQPWPSLLRASRMCPGNPTHLSCFCRNGKASGCAYSNATCVNSCMPACGNHGLPNSPVEKPQACKIHDTQFQKTRARIRTHPNLPHFVLALTQKCDTFLIGKCAIIFPIRVKKPESTPPPHHIPGPVKTALRTGYVL